MKKVLLTLTAAFACFAGNAQVITDTVSVGAGYASQVWYSLPNDEQGSAAKNNWDLAFDASSFGTVIHTNSANGIMLWGYPKSTIAGWSTVDTAGLSTWVPRWNSDTSWANGAMGNYANVNNPVDVDWGIYNTTTHVITGDSLYIIKLANGNYKKLWIMDLTNGVYNFKYADLNGSNEQVTTLTKSNYTGKRFGYYSIQNNAALDREPATANWDLVFTQYTTFIPQAYTVTGILQNGGVTVARCTGIPNVSTYVNYSSQTFVTPINKIGYDWKTFTGTAYTTKDSLLFFIKRKNGDIWKMICTGFGGSTTGNFIFSKEKLYTAAGIEGVNGPDASFALSPNPSNGRQVTLVYNFEQKYNGAMMMVYDLSGKTVAADKLESTPGLHQYTLPAQRFVPGMYIVTIQADGQRLQQKLIIQ